MHEPTNAQIGEVYIVRNQLNKPLAAPPVDVQLKEIWEFALKLEIDESRLDRIMRQRLQGPPRCECSQLEPKYLSDGSENPKRLRTPVLKLATDQCNCSNCEIVKRDGIKPEQFCFSCHFPFYSKPTTGALYSTGYFFRCPGCRSLTRWREYNT